MLVVTTIFYHWLPQKGKILYINYIFENKKNINSKDSFSNKIEIILQLFQEHNILKYLT